MVYYENQDQVNNTINGTQQNEFVALQLPDPQVIQQTKNQIENQFEKIENKIHVLDMSLQYQQDVDKNMKELVVRHPLTDNQKDSEEIPFTVEQQQDIKTEINDLKQQIRTSQIPLDSTQQKGFLQQNNL